jgi:CheY-like chemotaxis protein
MKILVLEDNEERIKIFRERMEQEGVSLTICDTVEACIPALENTMYDWLFLDHDLGGNVYVPSDGEEKTGWHVAKWLSENPDRMPETIVVHSLNPDGRKNIISLLPQAQDIPFAWKLVTIN